MDERSRLFDKVKRAEALTKDEQALLQDLEAQHGPEAPSARGHMWRISLDGPRKDPDAADVRYGPHERHLLDLWLVKSSRPTPLLVCAHGGGFRAGEKEMNFSIRDRALDAGISVASINYRYSQQAIFPASMHDGGRAVQFLRANARKWNIDPARIAGCGNSAGAGILLWLGFHRDLADPTSSDAVARESTRLSCMVVYNAQSSYDPRFIRKHIPGDAFKHYAVMDLLGMTPDEVDSPSPEKAALMDDVNAIDFVSRGGPPAYLIYRHGRATPTDQDMNAAIHHPIFGLRLKERMDAHGIECHLRCVGDDVEPFPTEIEFLRKHLPDPG
jgi:acetyl esterase